MSYQCNYCYRNAVTLDKDARCSVHAEKVKQIRQAVIDHAYCISINGKHLCYKAQS